MKGINEAGFVTEWLASETKATPMEAAEVRPEGMDQLAYEALLRRSFASRPAPGPEGLPPASDEKYWRYLYRHGAWFADFSAFYGTLTDIEFDLRAELVAETTTEVEAVLWTYAAVSVWVNGDLAASVGAPVYKPIGRVAFPLALRAGANDVILRVRNLGVRDTRNIVGLQLPVMEAATAAAGGSGAAAGRIAAAVPGGRERTAIAARFLDALSCADGALRLGRPFDFAVFPSAFTVTADGGAVAVGSGDIVPLPAGCRRATAECRVEGRALRRTFELAENIRPTIPPNPGAADLAAHRRLFIERLASHDREPRSSSVFFSVFHVLARLAVDPSRLAERDRGYLFEDLELITARVDCADFLVIGFVRLLSKHRAVLDDGLLAATRTALLGFRYWMDEEGSDGMCFWSENHALMFHGAQTTVGALYPDDAFLRSGRTGRGQRAAGADRCRAWIDDAERYGFEEFNSASYTPVTIAALLNLVDFGPEDIARHASALIDGVLRRLARHVFRDSAIGPQGRVYRDAIYPFEQSVQALLHYIDPTVPCSDTETMWNVCFATSSYRFPQDLRSVMDAPFSGDYVSGNARIVLEKTGAYSLSSVRSPRAAGDESDWTNLCFVEGADRSTNAYVKSLNERFHGTTVFRPGVYGYQQHLWYAALSSECVVFSTHPGTAVDMDGMRPGYWYGNGVMPALEQRGPVLAAVYDIPEVHPISFTHVFWPESKFDEAAADGAWRFARVGGGYLALWCSHPLTPYDEVLAGCELRCYSRSSAYVCRMGSAESDGSFSAFRSRCAANPPAYDAREKTVSNGSLRVRYVRHEDATQVI